MKTQIRKAKLWLMLMVLLGLVLACNMPTQNIEVDPTPQEVVLTTPIDDSSKPAPTDEQTAPDEASQPEEPVPDPGMSRAQPYPVDTEVVTPYWDLRVLETARGEAAWQIILADNPDAPPPPPGKEYFVAKVWMRNKNASPYAQNLSLDEIFITSDALRGYKDVGKDYPAPELVYSDIYAAEAFEGWIDVLVGTADGNLMLVFDRAESIDGESQPREVRYIALDQNASIEMPAEVSGIAATDVGTSREAPAKLNETVTTPDWEITILEFLRGQAAQDLVMQMNAGNKPPEDGLEYVAFRARVRCLHPLDMPVSLYASDFKTFVPGMGRNGSDQMEDPFVYIDPTEAIPHLSALLFPGGESEGWVVKQVPVDHTPLLVEYKNVRPGVSSSEWNERYFLLEP